MAGCCSGASTRIKNKHPKALYVHCASHKLNLCVAGSCKLPMIADMMSQFEAVALFFYMSPVRCKALDDMVKLSPEIKHKVVLNICRTRWMARLDGLDSFCDLLPTVLLTLEKISFNEDKSFSRKNMDTAKPLLLGITQFEFITVLVIAKMVLGYTRGLTVKLQSAEIDMYKASSDVLLLQQTLECVRKNIDTHYDKWYEQIMVLAIELGVDEMVKRRCGKQIHRENYSSDSTKDYYKHSVAIPFLDHLIQQVNTRFSTENLDIYSGFNIMPSVMFSDEGKLIVNGEAQWRINFKKFVSRYENDIPTSFVESLCTTGHVEYKVEKSHSNVARQNF